MPDFLTSDLTLADFLHGFETCSLPKELWTHAAHIAAGTVYLRRYGAGALPHIRTAIQRFNASKGGPPTAYHETLTIFWLAVLDQTLRDHAFPTDLAAARYTVERFGDDRKLHTDYYSYDILKCDEARTRWVASDIGHLDSALLP